ncbi:hypothetical protein H0E84_12435 [Luteimonas sp. SJ-92]|uniref:Uncharacterized protein n=1 Tax=Luteimonas salinisoli TaxID=2752307 RepID=A0A853JF08_9GAMM|nr:hypothetical protein [Luteimonas salinisoli]NZA27189.1 hypothetical protein [Luteimonas salinisoli]
MSLLILLGVMAAAPAALAQSVPRILQCEECTPGQREELAIAIGQTAGGSFYVFSLGQKALARYWVDYDRAGQQWIATPVASQDGIAQMFGHMLDAHASRPGAFAGSQVFEAPVAAIGGTHDPVAVAIRGEHDSAYGRFNDAVGRCFEDEPCANAIAPAFAAMLSAEERALTHGFSLFRGPWSAVAWEGPAPRIEARLCSDNRDCAVVKYREPGWTYTETRSEGGRGQRYPSYGERAGYGFDDAAAASRFERSLRNAGAQVEGAWQAGSELSCETAHATASCVYRTPPLR